MFGLFEKSGQKVSTYSGGMKRRLNIIIGILHDPTIIFLDEPTVGIDAQSRHLIMERLVELNRKGIAMIYISHYMEEIEKLCGKILIIDEGKIVARGTASDLVDQHKGCNNLADVYLNQTGERLRD